MFGAGQQVTQVIYQGQTWQDDKKRSKEMFDVYVIVFQLYQIRWFLTEAADILPALGFKNESLELIAENERLCSLCPEEILKIDVDGYRERADLLLKQVCRLAKEHVHCENKKCPASFLGKSFKDKDLSGFDLSMKFLIAADFSSCRFHGAIFLGADTRDADFSEAFFLG